MSTPRAGQPGATRQCPHCKAIVLESASICPGCRHHLRFSGGRQLAEESYTALSVDGTIAHRQAAEPCEYCVVLDISNERGEQVMRQVIGVGALQPGELRRLNLSVQMMPLVTQAQPRAQTSVPAPTAPAALAAASPRPLAGRPAAPAAATPVASASPGKPPASAPATPATSGSTAAGISAAGGGAAPRPPLPPLDRAPGASGAPAASPGGTPRPATPPAAPSLPQPPGASPSQRLRIFRKP